MRENFFSYIGKRLKEFIEAAINLIIFFPYYFSVVSLSKTLFQPWKNLVSKKTKENFSFEDWASRLSYNLISICIGFFIRMSVIVFYFVFQMIFLILIPLAFSLFIILIPIFYLEYLIRKTEEETKNEFISDFVKNHTIDEENYQSVVKWANSEYEKHFHRSQWWKIRNLFSIPPIGRDWAVGYTPTFNQYCEDLTTPSYQNKIKNIVGRQKEIQQIELALSKNEGANAIITGEEGVGKHTIVDAFSKNIYEGKSNSILMYKRVLKINMEKILTEFTDHKQRENLLESLFKEAYEAENIILLIDNFDKYIVFGEGRIDFTTTFEKFLKNPALHIIGITTPFFYQKFVFPNDKLTRFFTKIDVYEVSKNDAQEVLLSSVSMFESRYKLTIPYETVIDTIDKSDFFITYIPFPEKALELLDSVCVYAKESKINIVSPDLVDRVLSEKTHTPTKLSNDLKLKLVGLEKLLNSVIINQENAVQKLCSAIRRSFIMIGKRKKPIGTFLFLGPTGVGKTETAKALTKLFFGSEKNMLRFDMSLYQLKEDISKLIGSVDNNNPGLLSKTVRENPYGVLLLDEIEKANKDLLNIFLTILDEGYFTDGFGKRVDCKNLVIIATSNAGADHLNVDDFIAYLIDNKYFSPEFLNRFDGVITFNQLDEQAIVNVAHQITDKIINDIYKLYKIKLTISSSFINKLVENNYNQKFGARDMDRIVREKIEDIVAKKILENKIKEGDTINL